MKYFLFFFALLAGSAQAAPRILKGDLELGGGFNLTRFSDPVVFNGAADTKTYFNLYGDAQYFFADEFSAGVDLNFSAYGGRTALAAGPALTKYIWVDDKLAPYVSLLPIVVNTGRNVAATYSSRVRVGAKYFLTDSVAFGPAVQYEHEWDNDQPSRPDSFSFLGLFSIHL